MAAPDEKAYEYRRVSDSDDALHRASSVGEDHLPFPHASARARPAQLRWLCVTAAAAVLLVLAAAAGFVVGSTATRMAQTQTDVTWNGGESMETGGGVISINGQAQIEDCGETPAQARAKGCKYDPMLQQWVPAACYDEEHSEMYLSTYGWKWYYDIDAEREMPDDVMRRGEHEVAFMVDDYHRRHCTFVWEVTARAFQQQKPLLDEWLSYKHVHHCNGFLLSPPWNATKHPTAVETHSGYGRCAPYQVWVSDMPE